MTLAGSCGEIFNFHFNSHAHVERDQSAIVKLDDLVISTHTLTWSVTAVKYLRYGRAEISTHTLTWSVTEKYASKNPEIFHFNSHAHVERDEYVISVGDEVWDFNSHAHVERDT